MIKPDHEGARAQPRVKAVSGNRMLVVVQWAVSRHVGSLTEDER